MPGQAAPGEDLCGRPDRRDPADEHAGYIAVRSSAFGAADGFCMPKAEMILDEAVNKLGPAGSIHLMVNLMLPADSAEETLRNMAVRLGRESEKAGAAIDSFDVSVSDAVRMPVLNVSAAGMLPGMAGCAPAAGEGLAAECSLSARGSGNTAAGQLGRKSYAGYDLLMAGFCGMAGTGVLLRDFRERLEKHFPGNFLEKAELVSEDLLVFADREARKGREEWNAGEDFHMKAAAEGGIFAALWEMCEELSCGLEADIHRIPIRQETVEICEYLNRNPYRLQSTGAVLIAVRDGGSSAGKLAGMGIRTVQIGRLTEGPGRYIHNRDICRCLEKPLPDALLLEG